MDGIARTFRGLTPRRFAFFCLVVAFIALHQGITVYAILNGRTWIEKVAGPLRSFGIVMLVFTPVLLAVVAVENRCPRRGWARWAWLAVALLGGHAIGALLWVNALPLLFWGAELPPSARIADPLDKLRFFGGRSLWYLVYSFTALLLYDFMRKSNEAAAAMHAEQVRREAIQRDNAEARLAVMQAQIEPHFLFNTLASVGSLYRTDKAAGRLMLQHLTRYLTASLPSIRQSRSTLERELALATAYLSVHKIRMGHRLSFAVDVPAHLRPHLVPPMMIATLVENAVIHGLSPVPEGGSIRISARSLKGKLLIDVVDDGRGLKGPSWGGGGVGLANICSRLESEYGHRASFTLAERSEKGVIATLELPLAPEFELQAA